MITVERCRWIVAGVDVFAAGFVNTGQAFFRVRRICHRQVVVRTDVMVVQVKRDLKIIC